MNVELKPRTAPFLVPTPGTANDNTEGRFVSSLRKRGCPTRRRAVIYKPAKSAMTSGRAGTKRWVLEFEPQSAPFIEPLMGWTGSTDPMSQVRLTFPSRETAVAYATRQGLDYEVREPARHEKVRVEVVEPQRQPMTLWPLPHYDWTTLMMPDFSATGSASDLAA